MWLLDWWIVGQKPQYSLEAWLWWQCQPQGRFLLFWGYWGTVQCIFGHMMNTCAINRLTQDLKFATHGREDWTTSWKQQKEKHCTEWVLLLMREKGKPLPRDGFYKRGVHRNLNTKALLKNQNDRGVSVWSQSVGPGVSMITGSPRQTTPMYAYWGSTKTHTTTL